MVKELHNDLKASEFELQLLHYVHFQTNTFGKDMKPLTHPRQL